MSDNRTAFLDAVAWSEIGPAMLAMPETDNGYKVIVGSTPQKLILFNDYSNHPNRLIPIHYGLASTAAGRYQLLYRYYVAYKKSLNLPDFSPASQDAIALQQIRERGALNDIDTGHFTIAVGKVSNIWASLPGNTYGQHTNRLAALEDAYENAGGTFS